MELTQKQSKQRNHANHPSTHNHSRLRSFLGMAYVNQFCALCEATGTYVQLPNVSPCMMRQQVDNLLRNMERFRHRPEAHDPRVLHAIEGLPLPVEEKNRLVLKMSEISGQAAVALNGNSFQDWTSWPWFMTDAKCAELKALTNHAEQLLGVVGMPFRVGLRSPSEATLQTLTAVHLTIHGLVDLDSHHKKAALDEIKKTFRSLQKNSTDDPPVHIAILPPRPAALRDSHPQLYQRFFGNDSKFIEIDSVSWFPTQLLI